MSDQTKRKFALITGGSRGIGAACAITLAGQGYHVLINYKSNHDAATAVKSEIEEAGGLATLLPFDVSDRAAVRASLDDWHAANADAIIEVLVNNAGIRKDNGMLWMEDNEWDDVLANHLDGFYNVTRALIQPMVFNRFGRVINIVSLSGIKGMAGQTNYGAAKAGLIGATKSLAQEVAKRNVTVNCVAPGFIKTDMTADLDVKQYKQLIPMKRFGKAEEVAAVVGFLASSAASYITGEVINVSGGIT